MAREKGEVVMVVAFEFVFYPSATAVNVLAMAGRCLAAFMHRFLPLFRRFCEKAGADWIECQVSPAMERIHRRYGFATVYQMCIRDRVNADWNAKEGPEQILNKPELSTVATSGSYNDLQDKPDLSEVALSGDYSDLKKDVYKRQVQTGRQKKRRFMRQSPAREAYRSGLS